LAVTGSPCARARVVEDEHAPLEASTHDLRGELTRAVATPA